WELVGRAECHAPRDDRHAVHRVATRDEQPEQRMAALVVGRALAIGRVEQDVACGPERDLLQSLGEVPGMDLALVLASREESRLVRQVAELGADQARRPRRRPLGGEGGREGAAPDGGCESSAAPRARLKRSRTRAAPTPTISSMNSAALRLKKGTPAWPATARARRVFPVPGAPMSSTPFGTVPPSRWYLAGLLRKSTISTSS